MSALKGILGLVLASGLAAGADSAPASRAEKAEWSVRLEAPAAAGKAAIAVLHLAARAGYHVNLEYPISFRPAPGSAAGTAERVALLPSSKEPCQGRPQETCAVRLELPLPAAGVAAAPVSGTLAFSVCSADRCLIEKVALSSAGPGAT
jgi:hypothetical protein